LGIPILTIFINWMKQRSKTQLVYIIN